MNCPVPIPRVPMLQRGVTVLLEVHWLTETASTRLLKVSATNMVPEGLNAIAIGQLKLLVRRVVFGQLATLTPAVVNSSIRLLKVSAANMLPQGLKAIAIGQLKLLDADCVQSLGNHVRGRH